MKLYVTRHGQTEWNVERRMQGHGDSPLTQKGIDNARLLGKRLMDVKFDHVYSSPLNRAKRTAELIMENRQTDIKLCPELKEMGFGIWEGMPEEARARLYPEQHFNFWNRPELYQPVEGGESFSQFKARVNKWLTNIISEKPGECILVVTHTCVIKALYSIINGIPLKDFWKDPVIYDTSLSIIEINNDIPHFILEADISHLS